MRLVIVSLVFAGATAAAQDRAGPSCDQACLTARLVAAAIAQQACAQIGCLDATAGPAWRAGRMEVPNHGGYASVSSDSGAEDFILTCESRGPMSIILRSGSMDRGEVQLRVDGAGVDWLTLQQRAGTLVAELPRASRLLHALQDGQSLEVIGADGRTSRFGLRGSARAITAAMGYCAER